METQQQRCAFGIRRIPLGPAAPGHKTVWNVRQDGMGPAGVFGWGGLATSICRAAYCGQHNNRVHHPPRDTPEAVPYGSGTVCEENRNSLYPARVFRAYGFPVLEIA